MKKLDFGPNDKENQPLDDAALSALAEQVDASHKPVLEESRPAAKDEKPALRPEEADEPLLQDNPQRFVLFPIKYHEVCHALETRKVLCAYDFDLFADSCTRLDLANV